MELWLMQLPKSRIPISYWLRLVSYTNTQTAVQETLLIIHIGSKLELPIPNQLPLTFIGLVIEVPLNSWAANSVVCMGSNGLGLCRVQSMADFALPAGYKCQYCIYTNTHSIHIQIQIRILYRVQSMADLALPAGYCLLHYCSYNSYKYMCKGQFYKYKYTGKWKYEYCIND